MTRSPGGREWRLPGAQQTRGGALQQGGSMVAAWWPAVASGGQRGSLYRKTRAENEQQGEAKRRRPAALPEPATRRSEQQRLRAPAPAAPGRKPQIRTWPQWALPFSWA